LEGNIVRKLQLIIMSILLLMLIATIGCNEGGSKSKSNAVDDNSRPNPPETKVNPTTPLKDPVEEFRAYARTIVASAQDVVKDKRFKIPELRLPVTARFEISRDYSVDVKKSDSLISPYVGEIKLKRRVVYDQMLGIKDVAEEWHTIVIECGYQSCEWKVNTDLSERLMRIE
jgi:hypothetical protein